MGVFITLRDTWPKRHSWIVIGAFALAGFVALFATYQQSKLSAREAEEGRRQLAEAQKQSAVASAKLSESMDRLGTQTGEISRVQGLNTELQATLLDQSGQLIDSSKTITDLSKQSINTAIGGDSFCYVIFIPDPKRPGMVPYFLQMGKYPLYAVHARILDLQKFNKAIESKGSIFDAEIQVELGNLAGGGSEKGGMGHIPANAPLYQFDNSEDRKDFRIWFSAFNGVWNQDLQMRKTPDGWAQAVRVQREQGGKRYDIFKRIPKPAFPGNPDWLP